MIQDFTNYLLKNRGYSVATATEYRKDLEKFVIWVKQHTTVKRWSDVEKTDIDRWVLDMANDGLTATTIKRRVSALRGLYNYAFVTGMGNVNPAKYVSTPKKGHRLPIIADVERIIQALGSNKGTTQERALLAILAETGVRISEALAIRATDIDPAAHMITINGKGNKQRKVYYGERTAQALSQLHTIGGGRLFTMGDRQARQAITDAVGSSAHTVRHLWACMMLQNGADIKAISELMGHVSVKTTEIYAQVTGAQTATQYKLYHPSYGETRERKSA